MADHDVDPQAAEEERLMRALSRSANNAGGHGAPAKKPVVVKKAEPTPAAAPAAKEPAGAVPKWKQAQIEREEAEKKRQEEERKRKEEQAKVIQARVNEFGLGANQEDDNIEKYLTSPRGEVAKPAAAAPAFVDPVAQKAVEKPVESPRQEDLSEIPSYDERRPDERAAKEEERLMKMIGAKK